jgi:hypothetical protein
MTITYAFLEKTSVPVARGAGRIVRSFVTIGAA